MVLCVSFVLIGAVVIHPLRVGLPIVLQAPNLTPYNVLLPLLIWCTQMPRMTLWALGLTAMGLCGSLYDRFPTVLTSVLLLVLVFVPLSVVQTRRTLLHLFVVTKPGWFFPSSALQFLIKVPPVVSLRVVEQRNLATVLMVVAFTLPRTLLLASLLLLTRWTFDALSLCLMNRPTNGVVVFEGRNMKTVLGPWLVIPRRNGEVLGPRSGTCRELRTLLFVVAKFLIKAPLVLTLGLQLDMIAMMSPTLLSVVYLVTPDAIRGAAQSAWITQGEVLAIDEAVVVTMMVGAPFCVVSGVIVRVSGARLKFVSMLIPLPMTTLRVTCPAALVAFVLLRMTSLTPWLVMALLRLDTQSCVVALTRCLAEVKGLATGRTRLTPNGVVLRV